MAPYLYSVVDKLYLLTSLLLFFSGAQDSSVKLWDLRKLKNFKTITLDNNYEVINSRCSPCCGKETVQLYK